jgi:hypothetical protein
MKVLGISIITDQCLPDALEPASLEKIIAVANRAEPFADRGWCPEWLERLAA